MSKINFIMLMRYRLCIWVGWVSFLFAPVLFGGVVINEIHYDPDIKTEQIEFIELYNTEMTDVDLSGWRIVGGVEYVFPAGTTIAPHTYLVVAQNPSAFLSRFGISAFGPWTGRLKNSGEKVSLKNELGISVDQVDYKLGFPWPTVGEVGCSIELINTTLDNNLGGSWRRSNGSPTPGQENSIHVANAPPQIRQVKHSPKSPSSVDAVVITAKITDSDGVSSVSLMYQIVEPGSYITKSDPTYETSWTTLTMTDDGSGSDALAGDSIYSVVLPVSIQQHRRLIRYRILATDEQGESIRVPYADDPQPNFAYFCYDGIPAWQAAVNPGTTPSLNFSTNVMRRISAVHLISKRTDVKNSTWLERYMGKEYKWSGTLVYNGKVFDHIHYRARGGGWRYAMCKNMWKFKFNRGHDLQMRDNYGRKYSTRWKKLNLGAVIQFGTHFRRGEQGLFESVGSRLFNLAGVEAFNTSFLQLRIIDEAAESYSSNQYEGDFWGLYLAVEQLDGRFLDEHNLPDGNFYKMEGGTGELNNIGPLGPTDKSDLNNLLSDYNNATDEWWQNNWELDSYYSYQTIVQAIHHYDINDGKNFFYYHNPEVNRWQVVPWDLDLTWDDNMFNPKNGGRNALSDRILSTTVVNKFIHLGGSNRPVFRMAFRNRVREIRDLLFNTEQAGQLIDEQAHFLRDPSDPNPTFLDADRAMWDYNPKMTNSTYVAKMNRDKAGIGRFYQWKDSGVSHDFNGGVELMKNYIETRGTLLDDLAADSAIPVTPTLSFTGPTNYPLNGLSFHCSNFQGSGTFAAMEWRAGEVLNSLAPAYDPEKPLPYEITAKWESGELSSFNPTLTLPVSALKVGHAYRVRVRMKDQTGRWSHWSSPVEFIPTEVSSSVAMLNHLRISELMYESPAGSEFDFIELHNTGTNLLDVEGATFTDGVRFDFPAGTNIEPNGYLLVVGTTNLPAFRAHYGLDSTVPIAGSYAGKLSNKGETLCLKTGSGGTKIVDFKYGTGRVWFLAASGAGHSLVPLHPNETGQATGALDYPGNWRASTFVKGSPGRVDPAPLALTVVLNEIVAHTDYTNAAKPEYDSNDWIELYNASSSTIHLTNWYLSDNPKNPAKWPLPSISIQAGEYLVLNEVDNFHNPISSGFGLDKAGEQVLLSYLPGGVSNRVVDAVGFKGQENERSLARYPDATGFWYATMRSQGNANTAPVPALRISEFMYQPPQFEEHDNVHDEYIEIYNPTTANIAMDRWRINGGVKFVFPDTTVLPAGERLLIVPFDPLDTSSSNAFVTTYSITNALHLYGPYNGKLSNRSNRITLEKPQFPDFVGGDYSWVIADETIYANQSPWPLDTAATGKSLKRISFTQHGWDPTNWQSTLPSPGLETQDHDHDGIPTSWENHYGLNPSDPSDAEIDSDHDGLTNLQEYWSGTDPTDSNSVLQFDWIGVTNSTIALRFTAIAQKSYTIQYSSNLTTGSWHDLTNITSTLTTKSIYYIDSSSKTNQHLFYRLKTPAMLNP